MFRIMKKLNLEKASKLLPHGSVSAISFKVHIVQSTVSRILQGKEMKGTEQVRDCVYNMLLENKHKIENLLSE